MISVMTSPEIPRRPTLDPRSPAARAEAKRIRPGDNIRFSWGRSGILNPGQEVRLEDRK